MSTSNYIQWYNENAGRAYPVSETATRVDDAGKLLPDDILVDMGLMIDPTYTDVYLSSLRVTSQYVTLGISSPVSGLLVGTYLRDTLNPYKAYALTSAVDNVSGWVVFGDHVVTTPETYLFATPEQSRLELRVIRSVDALPVKSISKLYGNDKLTGIVKLHNGSGITLTRDPIYTNRIRVNLDTATGHNLVSPCNTPASRQLCKNTPFRTINGVPADANGKITLRFT